LASVMGEILKKQRRIIKEIEGNSIRGYRKLVLGGIRKEGSHRKKTKRG